MHPANFKGHALVGQHATMWVAKHMCSCVVYAYIVLGIGILNVQNAKKVQKAIF